MNESGADYTLSVEDFAAWCLSEDNFIGPRFNTPFKWMWRKARKLEAEVQELADGLPMLPKDIEVLREANLDLAVRNEKLGTVVEPAQDFLKWSEKEGQRDNWVMGEFDELWIKLRDVLAELEDGE
ncbi:hypothetical protein LCGC14_2387160 [marine sediment metagenome]|uniref:Uncharacterized protein n=1 Tax=marine sediment metagenome TaxID=412755 RepID=A0A0F9EBN0_9ZZZZ